MTFATSRSAGNSTNRGYGAAKTALRRCVRSRWRLICEHRPPGRLARTSSLELLKLVFDLADVLERRVDLGGELDAFVVDVLPQDH